MISVKFTVTNTYSSTASAPVLLNVASTGGKPVWYNNAASPTGASTVTYGYANYYYQYIYDGTYWVWAGHSTDNNTTYAGYSFGFGYGQCDTAAATVAKACAISNYALGAGGIVAIKFTYDVPAYATLNIRTRGAKEIYYRGEPIGEGVIKAGDTATFMYGGGHYQLLAIDRNIEIATVNETKSYLGIT